MVKVSITWILFGYATKVALVHARITPPPKKKKDLFMDLHGDTITDPLRRSLLVVRIADRSGGTVESTPQGIEFCSSCTHSRSCR